MPNQKNMCKIGENKSYGSNGSHSKLIIKTVQNDFIFQNDYTVTIFFEDCQNLVAKLPLTQV